MDALFTPSSYVAYLASRRHASPTRQRVYRVDIKYQADGVETLHWRDDLPTTKRFLRSLWALNCANALTSTPDYRIEIKSLIVDASAHNVVPRVLLQQHSKREWDYMIESVCERMERWDEEHKPRWQTDPNKVSIMDYAKGRTLAEVYKYASELQPKRWTKPKIAQLLMQHYVHVSSTDPIH